MSEKSRTLIIVLDVFSFLVLWYCVYIGIRYAKIKILLLYTPLLLIVYFSLMSALMQSKSKTVAISGTLIFNILLVIALSMAIPRLFYYINREPVEIIVPQDITQRINKLYQEGYPDENVFCLRADIEKGRLFIYGIEPIKKEYASPITVRYSNAEIPIDCPIIMHTHVRVDDCEPSIQDMISTKMQGVIGGIACGTGYKVDELTFYDEEGFRTKSDDGVIYYGKLVE